MQRGQRQMQRIRQSGGCIHNREGRVPFVLDLRKGNTLCLRTLQMALEQAVPVEQAVQGEQVEQAVPVEQAAQVEQVEQGEQAAQVEQVVIRGVGDVCALHLSHKY